MRAAVATAFSAVLVVGMAAFAGAQTQAASLDSSTLAIDATLNMQFRGIECPPNSPRLLVCYAATTRPAALVRGLGETAANLEVHVDQSDPAERCSSWTLEGSVNVSGKGAFRLAGSSEGCQPFAEGGPTISFTVTGGEGRFADASGNGFLVLARQREATPVQVTGKLTVAGYSFDTTAPTISAKDKTITVRKGVRAARVRYTVAARDDVDGQIPVRCKPKSGSSFKTGRTTVKCSAVDSSANEAIASFTVTVKRRAR